MVRDSRLGAPPGQAYWSALLQHSDKITLSKVPVPPLTECSSACDNATLAGTAASRDKRDKVLNAALAQNADVTCEARNALSLDALEQHSRCALAGLSDASRSIMLGWQQCIVLF